MPYPCWWPLHRTKTDPTSIDEWIVPRSKPIFWQADAGDAFVVTAVYPAWNDLPGVTINFVLGRKSHLLFLTFLRWYSDTVATGSLSARHILDTAVYGGTTGMIGQAASNIRQGVTLVSHFSNVAAGSHDLRVQASKATLEHTVTVVARYVILVAFPVE